MRIVTFNTVPSKKDHFWQIVAIPTITVLNSVNPDEKYIAVNFEWLFWSISFIFENDSKR
jgi:hypothetical protein